MSERWAAAVDWIRKHPSEFQLGLRIVIAGMLAFFVVDVVLGLPQSYWAVLTAVLVMQASLGGSIKASVDRIVGTITGALWGVVVALIVPHGSSWLLATALFLALAPLALLVAFKPTYRIAPVTAIIVLLGSAGAADGPIVPALHRVTEISVGSLVGLAVALLVLPARAHRLLAGQAAVVLAILAQQIGQMPARLGGTADIAIWQNLADRRRKAQDKAETLAEEAKRERLNRVTDTAAPEPLARTLRRLGVDMASVGRVTSEPWDATLAEHLAEPVTGIATTTAQFFEACAAALARRQVPPPIEPLTTALERLSQTVAGLRRDGLTRPLPGPAIERLYGLGFALDQMRLDAQDLAERVAELAPAVEAEIPG
jgi:uncharacterized membrane protein YccC